MKNVASGSIIVCTTVRIIDDPREEDTESFSVVFSAQQLSPGTGATLTATCDVTITDNDEAGMCVLKVCIVMTT